MLKKVFNNKMVAVGSMVVLIIILISILAHVIITHDPLAMDLYNVAAPPSQEHIWGTDELGRDIFSRVISGTRTSLIIAVLVVGMGTILGTLIGAISGYIGGIFDNLVMKIMDTLMAFPTILLALFFVTIFGSGLYSAIIGVGLSTVPRFARLIRGSVMSIKEKEYVEAQKAVGQLKIAILFKHILPNCIGPIIVQATLTMGNSIITVAGLGFLGLGADPGVPEWGAMLSDARSYLASKPGICIYPGMAIAITVLGFNLLGDGLRDILDVRQELGGNLDGR